MERLELVGGGLERRTDRSAGRRVGAVPNALQLSAPSDDPAARRRELLVVLALCRARAAGERERASPAHPLTLVRDG
jgi:hypothetical protein